MEFKYPHQPNRFPDLMMCLPQIRYIAGKSLFFITKLESQMNMLTLHQPITSFPAARSCLLFRLLHGGGVVYSANL